MKKKSLTKRKLHLEAEEITTHAFETFYVTPKCLIIEKKWATIIHSQYKSRIFNGVFLSQFPKDKKKLNRALEFCVEEFAKNSTPYRWLVWPHSSPKNLEKELPKFGLKKITPPVPFLYMPLNKNIQVSLPSQLKIVRVKTRSQLKAWLHVMDKCFKLGPDFMRGSRDWSYRYIFKKPKQAAHFLAYWNGKPAGSGTAMISKGVAGIFNIGTLSRFRRKGIGYAVTAQTVEWSRQQGALRAHLTSTKLGYSVYRDLGFKKLGNLELFISSV